MKPLVFVISFVSLAVAAPAGIKVESTTVDRWTTSHQLKDNGGRLQATFAISKHASGDVMVTIHFPELNRNYEARHAGDTTIDTLLESYVRNGVWAGGKVSLDGLQKYCATRGIVLKDTQAMMKRMDAAWLRAKCRNCVEDFRACQVRKSEERRYARPGVHVQRSCEAEFHQCSHGSATMATLHASEWPCGPAPAP